MTELGTPLADVTFCVIDLETTGSSARGSDPDVITEIGIVKVRGGECLGTLHTLVNPGRAVAPIVEVRTGLGPSMLVAAPRIEAVLPAVFEFIAGSVLVGHNVRFDVGFLNEAFLRAGWPRVANVVVDTLPIARRLFRDEVTDCQLTTLAGTLRLDHRPTHRALDDALATTDLLHRVLERVAAFGVFALDDLLGLHRLDVHPLAAKLRLTAALPRTPGVYLFIDRRGDVMFVGKAANIRQRVRSYFSRDERRRAAALLRDLHEIRSVSCAHPLEAAVAEARLIRCHRPRHNRQLRQWRHYVYVKLTLDEPFPRLAIVTAPKPGRGLYVGPLPSRVEAGLVIDAIHTVTRLRRCTTALGRRPPAASPRCTAPPPDGVNGCPCSGTVDRAGYDVMVAELSRSLTGEAGPLLEALRLRMEALAVSERHEDAAIVRDRTAALAAALDRQRRIEALRAAGAVRIEVDGGGGVELLHGALVRAWRGGDRRTDAGVVPTTAAAPAHPGPPDAGPLQREFADEFACVLAWLDAHRDRVRVTDPDSAAARLATRR